MYAQLQQIYARPKPYEYYTAELLWNDPHISQQMLNYHLDETAEPASRNRAFLDRSLAWLANRFQVGAGMRIADFGCGPGLYTTPLGELGAQVTGIDFSQRSIAHAKAQADEKGLLIDYRRQNYLEFSCPQKFDLITLIYCDFCALSPQQRKQLLAVFHHHLAAGGQLLLDVSSLAAYQQRSEVESCEHLLVGGFWSATDYYGFLRTFKYAEEKMVLDKYTIMAAERTFAVYNWLQYYSLEDFAAELQASGFQVVESYADVAGSPYSAEANEIAVIAKKA